MPADPLLEEKNLQYTICSHHTHTFIDNIRLYKIGLKIMCTGKGGHSVAYGSYKLKVFPRCTTRYLKRKSLKFQLNPSSRLGGVVITRFGD